MDNQDSPPPEIDTLIAAIISDYQLKDVIGRANKRLTDFLKTYNLIARSQIEWAFTRADFFLVEAQNQGEKIALCNFIHNISACCYLLKEYATGEALIGSVMKYIPLLSVSLRYQLMLNYSKMMLCLGNLRESKLFVKKSLLEIEKPAHAIIKSKSSILDLEIGERKLLELMLSGYIHFLDIKHKMKDFGIVDSEGPTHEQILEKGKRIAKKFLGEDSVFWRSLLSREVQPSIPESAAKNKKKRQFSLLNSSTLKHLKKDISYNDYQLLYNSSKVATVDKLKRELSTIKNVGKKINRKTRSSSSSRRKLRQSDSSMGFKLSRLKNDIIKNLDESSTRNNLIPIHDE